MADTAEKERRILVAVDEGEESMHALSWCLKNVISENSKDTLVLLYVKPPRVVYTALDGTGRSEHSKGIYFLWISWVLREPGRLMVFSVIFACYSGYLFSSDILAAMDRHGNDVADCVIEKAKRMCKDLNDVSRNFCLLKGKIVI